MAELITITQVFVPLVTSDLLDIIYTGGSHLSQIFWEQENLSNLKHYPAYPIIIISLIIQRNLATKIWAKRESGLNTVWLKRDPPVI